MLEKVHSSTQTHVFSISRRLLGAASCAPAAAAASQRGRLWQEECRRGHRSRPICWMWGPVQVLDGEVCVFAARPPRGQLTAVLADATNGRDPAADVVQRSPRRSITGTRCGVADAPPPTSVGRAWGWSRHLRCRAGDGMVSRPWVTSQPVNPPVGREVPWRRGQRSVTKLTRELQALTTKV